MNRLSGDRRRPPKKKKEREEPAASARGLPAPSGPFEILITDEARAGFGALPGNVKDSVEEIFRRLRAWPEVSGVRSFFGKGYAANKFRMKTWDWRVEFTVDAQARTITVMRIGHRDSFYDEYH